MQAPVMVGGFALWPGFLGPADQTSLVGDLRSVVAAAPLVQHETPGGRRMSVRMTCAGRLGWVSDRRGYRYLDHHPAGSPWPPIPGQVLDLWHAVTGLSRAPDCCLINFYDEAARMGLHQDKDEGDFSWPVVSISLGDSALFRIGGTSRSDPTQSVWLHSGDVGMLAGASRLAWHGIDRLRSGSSTLLPHGGRINVTLRVVDQGQGIKDARLPAQS